MKKTLFVVAALAFSASAFAQGIPGAVDGGPSLEQQQLSMLHNDLQVISAQLGQQHAAPQDPHSYCVFEDKFYSLGAKRDGQVCTTNTGAFGNENNPPQWVASQRAGRGSQ